MPMEEVDEILNMKMNIGPTITKLGNAITAVSIVTNNFVSIRKAYMALRLKHPAARHIVCVWNFPTDLYFDGSNYCEDEEIGVGSQLLDMMVRNQISHRAIFVVRYCGEKLHENRITAYLDAVKAVIKQAPYNTILECNQQISESSNDNPTARSTNEKQGRGGYRGRGAPRGRGRGRGEGRGGRGGTKEIKRYSPPKFSNEKIRDKLQNNAEIRPEKHQAGVAANTYAGVLNDNLRMDVT